jgi:hypothetical protein
MISCWRILRGGGFDIVMSKRLARIYFVDDISHGNEHKTGVFHVNSLMSMTVALSRIWAVLGRGSSCVTS